MAAAEFTESGYIAISERPEWAGMDPLRPPPASLEVVAIQSDSEQSDLLAYFWAAMTADEKSQRALDLSEEIILTYNSAHFSVWAWRWECLLHLGTLSTPEGVKAELALMRRVATDNPKNYQLWNHRRKFALFRGPEHVGDELEFAAACLAFDAKNYHAWAHRQAVVSSFGNAIPVLWSEELVYTERLIREDIRNNSAWNQRYFLLEKAPGDVLGTAEDMYTRELDFAAVKINLARHNEAAWGYLRALTRAPGAPSWSMGFKERIRTVCMEALDGDPSNVPALETLAEFYVGRVKVLQSLQQGGMEIDQSSAAGPSGSTADDERVLKRKEALVAAHEAARELWLKLQIADPSRVAYYRKRLADLS